MFLLSLFAPWRTTSSTTNHRPPFDARDPAKLQTELVTEEVSEWLDRGQPYKYQSIDGYSGTGLVIQDVHALPATVWKILLDFDLYPQRISKVSSCTTYSGEGNYSYQHLTLGFRWLSLQLFVQHESHPNVLLWKLDHSKSSDLIESVGYWYVIPHPTREGWSRVTYQVHVTVMEWVPSFVWKFMTKQALTEATKWVKTNSEASKEQTVNLDDPYCDANQECSNPQWTIDPLLPPIGISRYFLVSSVMGLLFFNTYLYFSHYR